MRTSTALSPNLFKNSEKSNRYSCATCRPGNANNRPKSWTAFNRTSTWSVCRTIPKQEPKTFSNQVEYVYIAESTIHAATTKWHLQHKGSDYQKFLCEVGNDCQKHLRSTAIDLIDNFMAITVKATFKAFPLQHHWCQKALHIRLQLVYTFLYNRDSQLVGCCWYLLQ